MWDLIGHEWAISWLRSSLAHGRASHAYLIAGPAGLGKRLLALRLAQTLICERGEAEPCLRCRHCRRAERGSHPDVRSFGMATQADILGLKDEEAEKQKALRVELVREFQRDINLRPYEARRRVFILHDAQLLNDQASNALLKTLEEPPLYVTLILVADTSGDLLSTIVSRCQVLRLRPLPREQVASALVERRNLPAEQARLLAAWSGGRIGWALHAAEHPDELETRQRQLDELAALTAGAHAACFTWAEQRARQYRAGDQAGVFAWLDLWQSWWRDILLLSAGYPDAVTHIDRLPELRSQAARVSPAHAHAFVQRLTLAAQQLRENVNPQLALENLGLHVP